MNRARLIDIIRKRNSFLCVGLDVDMDRIPDFLLAKNDTVFEFNKAIIDATKDLCVSYKFNIAFYECLGIKGWQALEQTVKYIGKDHFLIADAKRGDIGNTSRKYAECFLKNYHFDAITVAPYMGEDSITPFLLPGKWAIILALTSNPGSSDFQLQKIGGKYLYEEVLERSKKWAGDDAIMYVVGATHPHEFERLRTIIPNHFILVPGVGAQGGSLEEVCKYGFNKDCGLLVNSSRGIIYAGNDTDFAEKAREKALAIQQKMEVIIKTLS